MPSLSGGEFSMVKIIRGTAAQDSILGTQDADSIQAGAGSDLIYGFLGFDTIDGGIGYDTLFITGTAVQLNVATDAQLLSIEEVSAKAANGGVTIDLSRQIEGFVLTGSAYKDALSGGLGKNYIDAGDGDDTITGFGASDTVIGGGGADTLILINDVNDATDLQIAGIENITASSAQKGVTINLGRQSERFFLVGGAFGDDVTGGSGADVINTGAGNDKIRNFLGNDYLNGGDGADTLFIMKTSVFLNAAIDVQLANVETISAADAVLGVTIDLSSQTEGFTIIGSAQADFLKSGSGADTFIGTSGVDTIDGGFGDDKLVITDDLNNITNAQLVNVESISAAGATSGLIINLGAQNERLNITGSAWSDTVSGGIGVDWISTGGGDDVIKGFASADTVNGGEGFDLLTLTATSTSLNSATDLQLVNVEAVSAVGATGPVNMNLAMQTEGFRITGGNYSDTLKGGASDDSFYGFSGSDYVDGGKGVDTLFIQSTSANLNGASDSQIINVEAVSAASASSSVIILLVNQTEGFTITGGSSGDQLSGTAQSDIFNGFIGADTINGGGGDDTIRLTATSLDLNRAANAQIVNIEKVSAATATAGVMIDLSKQMERIDIIGGAGDDSLIGGASTDNLTGGGGADHFIFNGMPASIGMDKIIDFTPNIDKLELNHLVFTGLSAVGQLQAAKFWSSPTAMSAHVAEDRIVYNSTTGAVYYDADGLGGAAGVQILSLVSHPLLTANDILII